MNTNEKQEVTNMNEAYVSAYQLSCITGRPLPNILEDLRDNKLIYQWVDGTRQIPLSQFYKAGTNNI